MLAERPIVALRADAGPKVGLGHLRRALALASALEPIAQPVLLLHGDATTADIARQATRDVINVSREFSATIAATVEVRAHALVVDSYAVTPSDLATATGVGLLVVVDDSGRFPIAADIVVNSALDLAPPPVSDVCYLLGSRFALLDAEYGTEPRRSVGDRVERVLVCVGGAPRALLTGRVVSAIRRSARDAHIDVVAGPIGDPIDTVAAAVHQLGAVTVHRAPSTLRPLMRPADLAVSAGGVTLYELAASAVPTVGICLAPNQRGNLEGLARRDALIFAGDAADPGFVPTLEVAVTELVGDADRRRRLGARARAHVDGRGARRIAEAILVRLQARHVEAPRC